MRDAWSMCYCYEPEAPFLSDRRAILGELKQRWEQKLIDQGLLGGQEPSAPAPDAQGLAYAQPLAG